MRNPFIKILLDRPSQGRVQTVDIGQTQPQTYENPVYNKRFQFNVENDSDTARLQIIDSQNTNLIIETKIEMRELREYMDDQTMEIKEYWFDFQNEFQSQVRIQFNYLYHKQVQYDQQVQEWRTQLQEDVTDYHNIQRYLEQLQDPY